MNSADELDLLTAIWIMTSNDENHLITHQGIRYRLGLDPNFSVSNLIAKRPELFRRGAIGSSLRDWTADMLSGKHRPGWIKELPDEASQLKAIQDLSSKDVFRSQFRASKGSPPSPIAIIEWGLEHLDRIRAVQAAKKPDWMKRGTLIVSIVTIFVGATVALINYETTVRAQAQALQNTRSALRASRFEDLRQFCVTFMSQGSRNALQNLAPGKDEGFAQQVVDDKITEWRRKFVSEFAKDQRLRDSFEAYAKAASTVGGHFAPDAKGVKPDWWPSDGTYEKFNDAALRLLAEIERVCAVSE